LNTLSSDDAKKLLDDRVQLKLYAAEQHLKNLQNLDKNGIYMNSSFQSRVYSETQIESLLFQLVGLVDALLIRVNDKLDLGLNEKSIYSNKKTVEQISNKLKTQGKGELLTELQNALKSEEQNGVEKGEWLWNLRDLRNRGTHRQLINILVTPDEKRIIQLMTSPQTDLEVLPYLESSINKTKNLIEDIIKNESLLKIH
jgi:hypothetical protein